MSKRDEMRELYARADKVRPLAEKDGQVIVTFEDAATLNSIEAFDPQTGTGEQVRNADGSIASTGKRVHAINPDYFYLNRFKVKGAGASRKLYVVSGHEPTGFRCIREQEKGKVFIKTIPCYVFSREKTEDKESVGKLILEKVTTISDTEFISEFTGTLDNASMAELLPMITKYGTNRTAEAMPI